MRLKTLFLHPTLHSIILNLVRVLSLLSLIGVMLSTIIDMNTNVQAMNAFDKDRDNFTMVDCEYIEGSSIPNQPGGAFRAYLASLLLLFQLIILALSEVGWNTAFFNLYFPVLGSNFGLGILGIFQCLIATQILSHFVEDFTLVSAFVLFLIGCLNILLGLIFRESARAKRTIGPWRSRGQGVLPTSQNNRSVFDSAFAVFSSRTSPDEVVPVVSYPIRRDSISSNNGSRRSIEKIDEKSADLGGSVLPKPEESLPTYTRSSPPVSPPIFRSSPTAI